MKRLVLVLCGTLLCLGIIPASGVQAGTPGPPVTSATGQGFCPARPFDVNDRPNATLVSYTMHLNEAAADGGALVVSSNMPAAFWPGLLLNNSEGSGQYMPNAGLPFTLDLEVTYPGRDAGTYAVSADVGSSLTVAARTGCFVWTPYSFEAREVPGGGGPRLARSGRLAEFVGDRIVVRLFRGPRALKAWILDKGVRVASFFTKATPRVTTLRVSVAGIDRTVVARAKGMPGYWSVARP